MGKSKSKKTNKKSKNEKVEKKSTTLSEESTESESFTILSWDVGIINLAYETLKKIGVKNIVIEITAPFFLDSLFKKITNKDLKYKLKKYIKLKDINNCLKLLKKKSNI